MRWKPGGRSEDVEDVRGEGGGSRFRIGGPQLGIGGFLVVLVLSLLFKRDFFSLLGVTDIASPPSATTTTQPMERGAEDERQVQFISFVLDDVQKTWSEAFAQANQPYPHAKLVLFSDVARSGCGFAEGASGPFYCPEDHKVYIDLSFYDELKTRFGAPGEFAQAYVIAHEVGHHVQNLLGIDAKVRQMQARDPSRANELSVRLELQADCLAGVWGYSTEPAEHPGAGRRGVRPRRRRGGRRRPNPAPGQRTRSTRRAGRTVPRSSGWRGSGRAFRPGRVDACDTFTSRD